MYRYDTRQKMSNYCHESEKVLRTKRKKEVPSKIELMAAILHIFL